MPAPIGRPKSIKTRRLNVKQMIFVNKLFETGKPIEAYKAAGYSLKGKSSESYAWALLRNPNIKQEIDRRLDLVDVKVKTRLRNLTDLALDTLQAIIMDRENRLTFNKEKKIYEEKMQHMGAKPGVRRQAIVDLLGWVGIESVPMKVDSTVKNKTLADFIKAKKLLDRARGTTPKKENNGKGS
jgi:hypothetical protein